MNNEGALSANTDGFGHVMTFTYDGTSNCVRIEERAPGPVRDANVQPPHPQSLSPEYGGEGSRAQPRPMLTHTFEFRLCGSEREEQVVPLSGSTSWAAGRALAMERVRTYLTRQGETVAATSDIGGVEVHAELREGGIFCTVELSDFGAGDLVVVQIEVALY